MRSKIVCIMMVLTILLSSTLAAQDRPDALQLYFNGEYERAVEVTLQEIEEMPRRTDAYAVLGWSLIALGRYEEAKQYAQTALTFARYDYRIIEILAETHFYLGENTEALEYFEEYIELSTTRDRIGERIDRVYYFMGEIFIRIGEYNHADIALTTAVYYSPNVALWWSRLGYAREMAEDYNYSIEAYDRALDLNPDIAEARRGKERVEELMAEAG
ncbi:MAG: tetratricopeptide repeat protein [Spirochaetia bacterium]